MSTAVPPIIGLMCMTMKAWKASPMVRGRAASLIPRHKPEDIIDGAKLFTACEFVEPVKKKTGVKYDEPLAPPAQVVYLRSQDLADSLPSSAKGGSQNLTERHQKRRYSGGLYVTLRYAQNQLTQTWDEGALWVASQV